MGNGSRPKDSFCPITLGLDKTSGPGGTFHWHWAAMIAHPEIPNLNCCSWGKELALDYFARGQRKLLFVSVFSVLRPNVRRIFKTLSFPPIPIYDTRRLENEFRWIEDNRLEAG